MLRSLTNSFYLDPVSAFLFLTIQNEGLCINKVEGRAKEVFSRPSNGLWTQRQSLNQGCHYSLILNTCRFSWTLFSSFRRICRSILIGNSYLFNNQLWDVGSIWVLSLSICNKTNYLNQFKTGQYYCASETTDCSVAAGILILPANLVRLENLPVKSVHFAATINNYWPFKSMSIPYVIALVRNRGQNFAIDDDWSRLLLGLRLPKQRAVRDLGTITINHDRHWSLYCNNRYIIVWLNGFKWNTNTSWSGSFESNYTWALTPY